MFFKCFAGVEKSHSLVKKKAFSLWIHSKTDGLLHSRCSLAVVAIKIRIFSALTKGVLLFRRFVRNQKLYSRWGFAGVDYNFCFSIVSLAKKNRILAADP